MTLKKQIFKIKRSIKKFNRLIKQTLNNLEYPDRKKNLENYLDYLFLKRFYYNLTCLLDLLGRFKRDIYFKIPLGLVLRTCLSDILTYFYFIKIIRENISTPNIIEQKIYGFLVDTLYRVKTDLDKKLSIGEITQQEYDNHWSIIQTNYDDFFDANNNLIPKDCPSFPRIYEDLRSSSNMNWTADAYDFYNYLSKYEHLGAMTFDIQEIHKTDGNFDSKGIIISIGIMIEGVTHLIKSKGDKRINKKIDKICKNIVK